MATLLYDPNPTLAQGYKARREPGKTRGLEHSDLCPYHLYFDSMARRAGGGGGSKMNLKLRLRLTNH